MDFPSGQSFTDLATLQLAYDRLLHQAQQRAAFLGTASHELRAPINQIISLHQLILEDLCESPAEEREFIAQAHQAIHTVLKNLDLLISLSKLDMGALSPQLQPTPLAPVLARVQQLTAMQCHNRLCRLEVEPVASDVVADSDLPWLEQLLVMLIEAALAQGSTAIALGLAEPPTASTVTLVLRTTPGDSPTALPAALSPEFRLDLATRLAPHLQAHLAPGPPQQLTLPRSAMEQ